MKTIEAMQRVYEGKGTVCAVAEEKFWKEEDGTECIPKSVYDATVIVYRGEKDMPMVVSAIAPNGFSSEAYPNEANWRLTQVLPDAGSCRFESKGFWGRGQASEGNAMNAVGVKLNEVASAINSQGYWGPLKITVTVEPCTDYFDEARKP